MQVKTFRRYLAIKAAAFGALYLLFLGITLLRGQPIGQVLYELSAITMMFCAYVIVEFQVIIPERILGRPEVVESTGRRLAGLLVPLAVPFLAFTVVRISTDDVLHRAVGLAIASQAMLFYIVLKSESLVRFLREEQHK
ncbi:MAG: hypothetical protein P9M14_03975 [Candidatus Alcyoniella australis]|nr:hypothetical protein [Candidatus Alcyoniella australis]